jgi:hypothetical protein
MDTGVVELEVPRYRSSATVGLVQDVKLLLVDWPGARQMTMVGQYVRGGWARRIGAWVSNKVSWPKY